MFENVFIKDKKLRYFLKDLIKPKYLLYHVSKKA